MVTRLLEPDTATDTPSPNLVLRYAIRVLGINIADLAKQVDVSRQTIYNQTRTTDPRRLRAEDIPRYANALGVPTNLFFMEPRDAVRWLVDHKPLEHTPPNHH